MSERLSVDVSVARGDSGVSVRFDALPGVTVLFGPSGSGKTTVLDMVAGLVVPSRGRIALGEAAWFDAERGVCVPTRARRVGYVFQHLALFPHRTVLENVRYGIPAGALASRAQALLDRLGVGALSSRRSTTLSGGERQRVALARALASEPRVLLCDEALAALDRARRGELMALVRELVRERRIPALWVTHDVEEAEALGDHLVRIESGRVLAEGRPAEVLEVPARWGLAAVAAHDNRVDGEVVGSHAVEGYSEFRTGDVTWKTRPSDRAEGEPGVLVVRAAEVVVSLDDPGRVSASNVFQGEIERVEEVGRAVVLTVGVGTGVSLRVEVTERARDKLGLEVGRRVWVFCKARACHVVSA